MWNGAVSGRYGGIFIFFLAYDRAPPAYSAKSPYEGNSSSNPGFIISSPHTNARSMSSDIDFMHLSDRFLPCSMFLSASPAICLHFARMPPTFPHCTASVIMPPDLVTLTGNRIVHTVFVSRPAAPLSVKHTHPSYVPSPSSRICLA